MTKQKTQNDEKSNRMGASKCAMSRGENGKSKWCKRLGGKEKGGEGGCASGKSKCREQVACIVFCVFLLHFSPSLGGLWRWLYIHCDDDDDDDVNG